MKKLLYIPCIVVLVSCSVYNYENILDLKKNHETESNPFVLSRKNFRPSKVIFKDLNKKVSGNIIYIFSWVNHMPTISANFSAVVYDKPTGKTFYIGNSLKYPTEILISKDQNTDRYDEELLILKYALNGKINELTSLKPQFSSAEIGTYYYVFDTEENNAWFVKNLVLDESGAIFNYRE